MNLIFFLLAGGVVLLLAEIFLPGMIAGICGVLALLAATLLVFIQYGAEAGIYLLVSELVLTLIGFLIWMKLFPETKFGKQFILPGDSNSSPLPEEFFELLQQTGKTLTSLRPGGTIEIRGRRYDAVSEGLFIESGEAVRVVKLDGQIIVVRKQH